MSFVVEKITTEAHKATEKKQERRTYVILCVLCSEIKKHTMRALIQRVSQASVVINGQVKASIGPGLLILLGIEEVDNEADGDWIGQKIAAMRIFSDVEGKMNLSVQDIGGELLVVSQFTLFASTKKGNRPSFIRAARPDTAIPLYELFVERLQRSSGCPVHTGEFGADMQVGLLNDGPVTIWLDSRQRE